MVDKDVILAKTGIIQRCLARIKEVTEFNPDKIDEYDVQDIFVLNLERAIQAAIDMAVHVINSESWELPDTLKKNFQILEKKGLISHELSQKLQKMVGFRNIAVHDYQSINVEILKSILTHHLRDIEDFYRKIIEYYQL